MTEEPEILYVRLTVVHRGADGQIKDYVVERRKEDGPIKRLTITQPGPSSDPDTDFSSLHIALYQGKGWTR